MAAGHSPWWHGSERWRSCVVRRHLDAAKIGKQYSSCPSLSVSRGGRLWQLCLLHWDPKLGQIFLPDCFARMIGAVFRNLGVKCIFFHSSDSLFIHLIKTQLVYLSTTEESHLGLKGDRFRFQAGLHQILTVLLWPHYSSLRNLSFLLCKMDILPLIRLWRSVKGFWSKREPEDIERRISRLCPQNRS